MIYWYMYMTYHKLKPFVIIKLQYMYWLCMIAPLINLKKNLTCYLSWFAFFTLSVYNSFIHMQENITKIKRTSMC